MTEDQVGTEQPVEGQDAEALAPENDEASNEYREVEEGVQARRMTDEEREQRSSDSDS
jgi:hypothetical protein